jgi:hypothetical protein
MNGLHTTPIVVPGFPSWTSALWLALLDEVERLRRELAVHARLDQAGPIPPETLTRWRTEAEAGESNPDTWKLVTGSSGTSGPPTPVV